MDLFQIGTISPEFQIVVLVLQIWTIAWKGIALFRAAKGDQRYWFLAILVTNTFSILELVYLFRFAKKRLTIAEVKSWTGHLKTLGKKE